LGKENNFDKNMVTNLYKGSVLINRYNLVGYYDIKNINHMDGKLYGDI
jgi:hypothetical protein